MNTMRQYPNLVAKAEPSLAATTLIVKPQNLEGCWSAWCSEYWSCEGIMVEELKPHDLLEQLSSGPVSF